MDSTRISIARLLEADVPLTWQEAVAVVQEVAMVSDVETAMNGSPSLVTPASCFLTTAGDVELPETAAGETPGAVPGLLRTVLRGRAAPAALLALAQRHTDDLFGELAAFSAGPRRPVIAAVAARALLLEPVAGAPVDPTRDRTPAAQTALPRPSQRLLEPRVPPVAARTPTVVPEPAQLGVAPSPAPSVDAAPPPAVPDAQPRRSHLRAVDTDTPRPSAPARSHDGPPAVSEAAPRAVPARLPPHAPTPAPTSARVVPASTPSPRRPPAPLAVPEGGPTPPGAVAGELQRLRLKSVSASARREQPRFMPSRRAAWFAGGTLAASVLAALLWSPRPATPALLEAKYLSAPPAWRLKASVTAVSPVVYTTRPTQFVSTSRISPPPADSSTAAGNVWPMATASPRDAGVTVDEAPLRDRIATGDVVPAAPVPADGPRVDRGSLPPATEPPAAAPPLVTNAPSPVAGPTTERGAPAVGASRSRAFRRETFSPGDVEVAPPNLVRQQLPTAVLAPGTPVPDGWPYLTLVVDETGVVESVRLTASAPAPGQSLYRQRMLVAAAKAWQFTPARRNGQPVRYAIQVPLEP